MTAEAQRRRRNIDRVLALILACTDDDTKSVLTNHCCVLMSGHLERTIVETFLQLTDEQIYAKCITNFSNFHIRRFQNADFDKVCTLAGQFDSDWSSSIREENKRSELKDHIDSLVGNRHQIAHGNSVSITEIDLVAWLPHVDRFLELVEQTCCRA